MTKSRPEDRNLAPEQFAEMNQRFYGTKMPPHAYIDRRLRGLFLTAQGPERLPDTFDEPLTIGEVKATWGAPDDDEGEEVRDFVTAESTVLLHHAAEALFRLYLAHVGRPACPWLEVARLRTPREFKDRVEEFLAARADEASSEGLMDVFTGHPRPTVAPPDEQWTAVQQGASSLMGHLGRLLLQDGPLYNAAKHGLAVRPGAAAMAFGNQETDLPVKADGPSITHLTIGDSDRGKRWYETTTWVDAERNLTLTSLAITQLRALWAVARFRYTEQPWEPSEVRWVTGAAVEAVLAYPHKPDEVRLTVPSMSMELLYYLPEPTK